MNNTIVVQDTSQIVSALGSELKQLEGKTILISGGAGFLGSYFLNVAEYLNNSVFRRPCTTICIDNYITGSRNNLTRPTASKYIIYIQHDVSKRLNIRRKLDFIIHAAGIASPIYYKKFPLEAIDVNTQGTKNLLELGNKNNLKSFLYFSSSEIYGDPDPRYIPTPESYRGNVSSIGPRACYDESKRLGEALSINYFHVYKVPVKIVRPFNIYGPGMKPTDYRVIPTFVHNALINKPLPVHDKGKQTRTYCYISDAITELFKVLLSGVNGEVYNIGNDYPEITTLDLANKIRKICNNKVRIKLIPYPNSYPTDVPQRRCPDLSKIKQELKYHPKVSLHLGLLRTMKWYKETYE
ncbi:MAG: NAD-dependent epimerase/dehydratase family protein [Patescibacteria group bacterium]